MFNTFVQKGTVLATYFSGIPIFLSPVRIYRN